MAVISPFRGVRYVDGRVGNIEAVVAPPYDVISPEQRDDLIRRSPWNIISVDLPAEESADEPAREKYERSARIWKSWIESGIVSRDADPAIYLIEERFTLPDGKPGVRHGFVSELQLEELGADTVAPHERTFAGPKADRLELMRSTHANLSQVFALYRDPAGKLDEAFASIMKRAPDATVEAPDGTRRMWVVTGRETIGLAITTLAKSPLTIADGHHRYETALTFREEARQNGGPPGAESLMVYLSNMDSPDLTVLPYHRIVKLSGTLDMDAWRQHLLDCGTIESAPPDNATGWLSDRLGSGSGEPFRFGLFTRHWGWELFELTDWDTVADMISPERSHAWRHLDVAVLHECVIGELARRSNDGEDAVDGISYTVDAARGESAVRNEKADVFCMVRATSPCQIVDVIREGDTMPQKSTYFFPKLLTGLVMRTLD